MFINEFLAGKHTSGVIACWVVGICLAIVLILGFIVKERNRNEEHTAIQKLYPALLCILAIVSLCTMSYHVGYSQRLSEHISEVTDYDIPAFALEKLQHGDDNVHYTHGKYRGQSVRIAMHVHEGDKLKVGISPKEKVTIDTELDK